MKKFLFPLLLFTGLSLHAGGISWYGEYDKALEQAIKEEKPIMVLLLKPKSPQSREMLSTTLKDQPYIDWINRHFVSVLITEGTKSSYPIELLYTMTYPTLFFLTPRELFLSDPIVGAVDANTLGRYLENLTNSIKK